MIDRAAAPSEGEPEWVELVLGYRLDPGLFVQQGRFGIAERGPEACPKGHPFGPDRVLVSAHPCSCSTRPHRLWRCWECGSVWVRPPCLLQPDWTTFG